MSKLLSQITIDTPLHPLRIHFDQHSIHYASFVHKIEHTTIIHPEHEEFRKQIELWVSNYFQRKPTPEISFNLSTHTAFQQDVVRELLNIECGQTISYKELALRSGRPNASRAVGSVMAANPILLFIPCHRVIQTSGHYGAYSGFGGVKSKQSLLDFEANKHNYDQ
jgi:AraC family transcriptional regulator of adaptative response/methylated-DNA-[protein]-cysteine methyltransferase